MRRLMLPLLIAAAFALSACSTATPKGMVTMPLISDGTMNAFNVSVAVEADGDKHIVWSECPTTGYCRVVYQRTRAGELGPRVVFSNPSFGSIMANVAVLDDGRAVVAFQWSTVWGCQPQYAIIPNTIVTQPAVNSLWGPGGAYTSCFEKPTLVTNGTTMYTVFSERQSADYQGYRYRKLVPSLDAESSLVVQANTGRLTDFNSGVVAGVDTAGNLHVAYTTQRRESGSPTTTYGIEYANNNGVTGNLTPLSVLNEGGIIDMVIESPTRVHIAYSLGRSPSWQLWVARVNNGVVTHRQFPLDESKQWRAVVPRIAALDSDPSYQVVYFTAENTDVGKAAVFYILNTPTSTVQLVSDTLTANGALKAVPFDDLSLAGWRNYYGTICLGDVVFSFGTNAPQTVFKTTGGCTSYGQTMEPGLAARGRWAAGVWIDRRSTTDTRMVPWITFNTNTINLPMVIR